MLCALLLLQKLESDVDGGNNVCTTCSGTRRPTDANPIHPPLCSLVSSGYRAGTFRRMASHQGGCVCVAVDDLATPLSSTSGAALYEPECFSATSTE